jgi:uncharacterized membrane protein HdeD (DUF308 family)
MAETTKLKAIQLGEYRWVFLTRGIILLVFGLWGIICWWLISLAGTKMLGIYVSMIFISEGLMTMAVSIFIRKLKYWWVTLIAGSVSLLSGAIILMAGERSEIVTFVIGGWCILKALFVNFIGPLSHGIPYLRSGTYCLVCWLLFCHSRKQPNHPEFLWFKKPRTPSIRWITMINQ